MSEPLNLREQALASALLFASAGKASATIDKFSNWLMAGYAAAVALLISRPVGSRPELPRETMRIFLMVFMVVAILGVVAKLLSILAVSASEGNSVGRELAAQAVKDGDPLDAGVFMSCVLRSMPRSMRWIAGPMLKKALAGDLLAGSRLFLRVAQIQGLLTITQAGLILWTVYIVASTASF